MADDPTQVAGSSETPPSIDQAFDWLKDVLDSQLDDAAALDNKVSLLFALTTSISGLGFPFGITLLKFTGTLAEVLAGVVAIIFVAAAISAWNALKFRQPQSPPDHRGRLLGFRPHQFQDSNFGAHGRCVPRK